MLNSKATPSKIFDYLTQEEKTEKRLIGGKDCNPNFVKDEFMLTQRRFKKTNGIRYHHLVQSFSPNDNITLDKAHELGEELAKQFEGYEVFIATHKDKEHIHNHLVINSVNFETGKKYRSTQKRLWDLKRESNRLCEREGFATLDLDKKAEKRITSGELRLELRGVETWKKDLRQCIDYAKEKTENIQKLCDYLKEKFNIETRVTKKTISYKHPNKKKPIRGKKLGESYTKGELEIGFTRSDIRRREEEFNQNVGGGIGWSESQRNLGRDGETPRRDDEVGRTTQERDREYWEYHQGTVGENGDYSQRVSERDRAVDRTTGDGQNRDESGASREDSRDTEFEWENRECNREYDQQNDAEYDQNRAEDDEWDMEL